MLMMANRRTIVMRSAIITPLYLIGSFFVGAMIGNFIFSGLPGHLDDAVKVSLAVVPTLICVIAGGALWGRAMARLAQVENVKRLMWAGALGYGPTVILVAIALTVFENLLVEQRRVPDLPIHNIFTILFVPAAFVIATVGALAIGVALNHRAMITRLALGSGLAAATMFFVVDILMDAIGYRVGAPGAAERATMITVMLTANVAASLAAGAIIGLVLSTRPEAAMNVR